ncbi:TadE/TadG family type IV pilus assembly protein [Vibrio maerlii]|uniref:TadE/TadG family type IV pilus assembly protein n=1 Tax=Vibrio maerlii TaxID=2231648 RepID=UPI000E3BD858|nr:vWA domain-containing protein [Vibrio maerlii]
MKRKIMRFRGLVAVLSILVLPVLFIFAGMAIDTSRAYIVKAKMLSAVDAAGLAAARAVANGESEGRAAARKYFTANMPTGFYDATATLDSVTFTSDTAGNIEVDLDASATMPTTFLKLAGISELNPLAEAATIRRPVDLALVIDNSSSLFLGTDVTQDVIDRSKDFVGKFNEQFDRIALVNYAAGAQVPISLNTTRGYNRTNVNTAINGFTFSTGGEYHYTNASEGFYLALEQLRNASTPANLQVIVFFTDGAPNTFASRFRVAGSDRVGAIRTSDGSSGTPNGLWRINQMATVVSNANHGSNIDDELMSLPQYYTAHDSTATEFNVLNPLHPNRPVTQYDPDSDSAADLFVKVNRVSRNLVEDMAEAARIADIYVFTLGLGSALTDTSGPDAEKGEDLLLRMANSPKLLDDNTLKDDYKSNQLNGVYCHAVDEDALGPCFDEMLDVIIRLTM